MKSKILDIHINEFYSFDDLVKVCKAGIGVDYSNFKLYRKKKNAINCLKYWREMGINGTVFYYKSPTKKYPDCWELRQILFD